jgi:hypothetical protein
MTVNKTRGEVMVRLGVEDYTLCPSFQAIAEVEAYFARGVIDVARDYYEGKITRASDFCALLSAGIKGGGAPVPEDIGNRMIAEGLQKMIEPLGRFLAHACGLHDE